MKRRVAILLALVMAVAMILPACRAADNGADANVPPAANGTPAAAPETSLIIGMDSDATRLCPFQIIDVYSLTVVANIFDFLVYCDPQGNMHPGLATSWDISDDGLVYTFHLRTGLYFHNGQPVTAEDVKFSIDMSLESPHISTYFEFIDRVEVVDQSTVRLILHHPYGPTIALFSYFGAIVPQSAYEAMGPEEFARNPIGSGPYRFVEWLSGDRIVLEAFEDFRLGRPAIQHLTFRVITDRTTGTIALELGEIDMFINAAYADISTIQANPNLDIIVEPSMMFFYLGVNARREPFDDIRVRQAIAMSLNKDALIYGAMDGHAIATNTLITSGMLGYIPGFDPFPRNIDAARALLAEAGHPDGFSTSILVPEARAIHAQIIQADLREIGIHAEIDVVEFGRFWVDIEAHDFDLVIPGWGYVALDPDLSLYSKYYSASEHNYGALNNPRVDELVIAGRLESDPARRHEIYQELERLAQNEAVYIPLYWRIDSIAFNNNIRNVSIPVDGLHRAVRFSW